VGLLVVAVVGVGLLVVAVVGVVVMVVGRRWTPTQYARAAGSPLCHQDIVAVPVLLVVTFTGTGVCGPYNGRQGPAATAGEALGVRPGEVAVEALARDVPVEAVAANADDARLPTCQGSAGGAGAPGIPPANGAAVGPAGVESPTGRQPARAGTISAETNSLVRRREAAFRSRHTPLRRRRGCRTEAGAAC
jgi:hypothetical protein